MSRVASHGRNQWWWKTKRSTPESCVENIREFSAAPKQLVEIQQIYNNILSVTLKREFSRHDGPDHEFCLRTGLKRHSTEDVINRYLTETRSYREPVGLKFPRLECLAVEIGELLLSMRKILASLQ